MKSLSAKSERQASNRQIIRERLNLLKVTMEKNPGAWLELCGSRLNRPEIDATKGNITIQGHRERVVLKFRDIAGAREIMMVTCVIKLV